MRRALFACYLLGLIACRDSFADTSAPVESAAPKPSAPAAAVTSAPASSAVEPAPAQAPSGVATAQDELLISAIGDCTLGDDVPSRRAPGSFAMVMSEHGDDPNYPFAAVREILEKDDLTVANLETTLTDTAPPAKTGAFQFAGKPEFAKILPAGSVEVANVANNHSHDMGERGYGDTLEALKRVGVGGFGNAVVDKRVVKGVEIVNLGFTGGDLKVLPTVQKRVREAKTADNLVFVSIHWGIEGSPAIVDGQQKLGRAAVDAGADLVIGTHPHVLQGVELYRGKHIAYSLGNFVFGGNSHPADTDSMIYQERFKKRDGHWEVAGNEMIPVRISTSKTGNDYRPVVVDGEDKERVLARVKKMSDDLPKGRPSP